MAALADKETVKAPGTLVVSGYCSTDDITKKVTPDLKGPSAGFASSLIVVDISKVSSAIPPGVALNSKPHFRNTALAPRRSPKFLPNWVMKCLTWMTYRNSKRPSSLFRSCSTDDSS